MITLYDIPSKLPQGCWSPNTRKARYCLKFKGIPYEVTWVEYPDIEPTCKKIGAPPTTKRPDGSPLYTFPVIHDSSTGAVIADSVAIAEYLEITYPDTPKLFPPGTKALQIAFDAAHLVTLNVIYRFIRPGALRILNPPSEAYFREQKFGPNDSYLPPEGEEWREKWEKVKESFDLVNSWCEKSDGEFMMGNTISFADLAIGCRLYWIRELLGEQGAEWQDLKGWHGGRWSTLLQNVEKYA
ncbi:hypothetical protein BDZ94DRAFT_1274680 [Collybia nuda]|uniref:GST N-terminal domain-containing protein n=1 Tax=Collybia nuda TaxID=64659 RepID=A0A9P5XW54_9AGAR|nr:hypothetical protein BDZ94DRAFT_1274680 [Collybia nuda]